MRQALYCLAVTLCACGGASYNLPAEVGGDRPTDVIAPLKLDVDKKYPLILVLHGYGADGFQQSAYFGAQALAKDGRAIVVAPDGLVDESNRKFWNADPACCAFGAQKPDDSSYLRALVEEVIAGWPIDRNEVYVMGHSNGGFMAYRLACDHADLFGAVVSLAGAASSVPTQCQPSRPVAVLQIHGTEDASVPYRGAAPSVEQWAGHNRCTGQRTDAGTADFDNAVTGAETTLSTTAGCEAAADLWTMTGSGHIPGLSNSFASAAFDWLRASRRQ